MKVGENPNKVANIVKPNIEHFRNLYKRSIDSLHEWMKQTPENNFQQVVSLESRVELMNRLPASIQTGILKHAKKKGIAHLSTNEKESYHQVAKSLRIEEVVNSAISELVGKTARTQSLKGILTGGIVKSVKYAYEKVGKKFEQ